LLLAGLVLGLALLALGYWTATREPVVRETRVMVAGWPQAQRPLRVLLVSDIHVGRPDMPIERLERIVEQMNALRPDLVLIAGDFVSHKSLWEPTHPSAVVTGPLAALKPPLGVFAVLGNHDHWGDAAATYRALAGAGVRTLTNQAVRVGPFALGGLDDDHTGRARLGQTLAEMRALGGVPILLSHSPDPFPDVPEWVPLMVAGHTHCGQISLPLVGPLATASRHGRRYACGRIDENKRTLIVGAGLGTSVLPLRIGAVPDMWLIEVGAPAP
jgi:hypothetical protein